MGSFFLEINVGLIYEIRKNIEQYWDFLIVFTTDIAMIYLL